MLKSLAALSMLVVMTLAACGTGSAGESAVKPSRAGLRSAGRDLRYPDGGGRRRLFLGRAGRLPASQGREERVVRLCRRRTSSAANYESVTRGDSGHAESVQIVYDPAQVSYGQILQVFFSVAHDPTQLNRQGPDVGTQYRSAIFYTNDAAEEDGGGLHRAARQGRACFRDAS